MSDPFPVPSRAIRAALARRTYADDRVRLIDANLAGCECLFASRQGLYGVARGGLLRKVAHGHFFGIRAHGDAVYAFESCDRSHVSSRTGRIVRFCRTADGLEDPVVLARGLDNRCHQLAVFDDAVWVVDTANQAIVQLTLEGVEIARHTPFPVPPPGDTSGVYLHLNSIAMIGGRIALMLHNGAAEPARPSELAWFDRTFTTYARHPVAGYCCHDIVEDTDGTLWHCGSLAGELIHSGGLRHKVSAAITRGLAMTPATIIVGSSNFATRARRMDATGCVYFLDRDLREQACVAVPAAPTDLIAW